MLKDSRYCAVSTIVPLTPLLVLHVYGHRQLPLGLSTRQRHNQGLSTRQRHSQVRLAAPIACISLCKHRGGDKGDTVRCCLCAAWFHELCVGITTDVDGGSGPAPVAANIQPGGIGLTPGERAARNTRKTLRKRDRVDVLTATGRFGYSHATKRRAI